MITFINASQEKPYLFLKEKYDKAINLDQNNIEAISISSFNANINEVDSRYVNLKYVDNDKFIFFTNYDSPKALAFETFDQISAILFWPKINTQIRMKAIIKKTSSEYNKKYFKERLVGKNALAISSNQSKKIGSYNQVIEKYQHTKSNSDLKICPTYWGGYSFTPYEFEFWEGKEHRLNKRYLFTKNNDGNWDNFILEP